jgi:hypothetical protein
VRFAPVFGESIPGVVCRLYLGTASTRPSTPRAYTSPHHLFLGLAIPSLLFELSAEGLQLRFQEPELRPITRRWGICFRSIQRCTVCGLTPRKMAASRTRRGSSSRVKNLSTRGGVREFDITTSREWCLRQLFEQFAADAIESPFFHDVEIGFYTDRFVKGQLPLPHVANDQSIVIRRNLCPLLWR